MDKNNANEATVNVHILLNQELQSFMTAIEKEIEELMRSELLPEDPDSQPEVQLIHEEIEHAKHEERILCSDSSKCMGTSPIGIHHFPMDGGALWSETSIWSMPDSVTSYRKRDTNETIDGNPEVEQNTSAALVWGW